MFCLQNWANFGRNQLLNVPFLANENKNKRHENLNLNFLFQVTTLVSSKSPQKKKGKSKRAHVLVPAVERATANFVERGQQIALENPDIEPEMIQAVEEVQNTGEAMSTSAREFAIDPCSSAKRGNMVSHRKTRQMTGIKITEITFQFDEYFGC